MYKFSEYLEHRDPKLYESIDEGVVDFGKNLWQGAKQLWQGVKQGAQAGISQITGPKAQYKKAMEAIKTTRDAILADEAWKNSWTTGNPKKGIKAMPFHQWLTDLLEELDSQLTQVSNKQISGTMTQAAPAAPGAEVDPAGRKGI